MERTSLTTLLCVSRPLEVDLFLLAEVACGINDDRHFAAGLVVAALDFIDEVEGSRLVQIDVEHDDVTRGFAKQRGDFPGIGKTSG